MELLNSLYKNTVGIVCEKITDEKMIEENASEEIKTEIVAKQIVKKTTSEMIDKIMDELEVKIVCRKSVSRKLQNLERDILERLYLSLEIEDSENMEAINFEPLPEEIRVYELLFFIYKSMVPVSRLPRDFVKNGQWKVDDLVINREQEIKNALDLQRVFGILMRSKHLVIFNSFAVGEQLYKFKKQTNNKEKWYSFLRSLKLTRKDLIQLKKYMKLYKKLGHYQAFWYCTCNINMLLDNANAICKYLKSNPTDAEKWSRDIRII